MSPLRLILCIGLTLCAVTAHAQTGGKGMIRGKVYQPGGAAGRSIPVRLFFVKGGTDFTVSTDSSGGFVFDQLAAGTYLIKVEGNENFATTEQRVVLEELMNAPQQVYVPIYLAPRGGTRSKPAGTIDASTSPAARAELEGASTAAKAGRHDEAEKHLERAVELDGKSYSARFELGMLLFRKRSLDEAVSNLEQAVVISPSVAEARVQLGAALLEARRFTEAASSLNAAMDLEPSSGEARMYRGIAYIGLKDLSAAERDLLKAVELRGGVLSHYYLGGIYMAWKQNERAARELETYLKECPAPRNADRLRQTIEDLRRK